MATPVVFGLISKEIIEINALSLLAPKKVIQLHLSFQATPRSLIKNVLQQRLPYLKSSQELEKRTKAVLDYLASAGRLLSFDPRCAVPS